MNDIAFSCPECTQPLACDPSHSGESVACPICQAAIQVPVLETLSHTKQPDDTGPSTGNSTTRTSDWKQLKMPMGLAALILTVWGRVLFPAMGQVFGTTIMLFAFVFTLGGFVLSVVSLFKKDGWEFGIIAMALCILLSLLF